MDGLSRPGHQLERGADELALFSVVADDDRLTLRIRKFGSSSPSRRGMIHFHHPTLTPELTEWP